MLDLATKPVPKLSIIASLFNLLHDNSIRYCHWKSNEHLAASMQGLTDLDVLFDETQKEKVESILHQLGFKKFNAISQKRYKDIVDFLALDPDSGTLVHLHTHYRLTMGEPYLKGYQFNSDIENQILNSRIFNQDCGLYCIRPALELVLLFFRESLRLRHRDIFPILLKNKIHYNEHVLREFSWLKIQTHDSEVREVVKVFFRNDWRIKQIITGELNTKQLYRLSSIIKGGNSVTRLYPPVNALLQRWYREATVIFSKRMAAVLDRPLLFKRINPRGGIVVALIGADGSGKSTVTENLKKTFEGKLDVYKIYFGRGDGKASWSRRFLRAGKKLFRKHEKKSDETGRKNMPTNKTGFITNLYKCLEALLVAREKTRNLKLAQTAKRKGAFVICDRYPQNQIMGYNDGPLLDRFMISRNPLLRALARIECKAYAQAEKNPPDLLFKLAADVEVVEKRKPGELSTEKLQNKIRGIKALAFRPSVKVITIDATKPLNDVLLLIKKEIWSIL